MSALRRLLDLFRRRPASNSASNATGMTASQFSLWLWMYEYQGLWDATKGHRAKLLAAPQVRHQLELHHVALARIEQPEVQP